MTRNAAKRHRGPPDSQEPSNVSEDDGQPQPWDRKPWETSVEYQRFQVYMLLGPNRSIREAYREFARAGKKPKDNPPSTWYQLYNGHYLAFRQADARMKAIERPRRNITGWLIGM